MFKTAGFCSVPASKTVRTHIIQASAGFDFTIISRRSAPHVGLHRSRLGVPQRLPAGITKLAESMENEKNPDRSKRLVCRTRLVMGLLLIVTIPIFISPANKAVHESAEAIQHSFGR
jgi:hypothetical protein